MQTRCFSWVAALVASAAVVLASRFLRADDAPAADPAPAAEHIVKLPAEVDQVGRAAGGDLLLLQFNKLSNLAVFDLRTEKLVGYVPLGGADTLVAGTADAILLVARDKGVMQRWSLNPLAKKLTVPLPITEEVDGLAAGYASTSPVMLMTRGGPLFLDPVTLRLQENLQLNRGGNWSPHPQYPLRVEASADGSTFAAWEPNLSPSGVRLLRLDGGRVVEKYAHDSAGALYPSWDGSLLFTSRGVYTADLHAPNRRDAAVRTFPTSHAAYYLGLSTASGTVAAGNARRGPGLAGDRERYALSLFTTSERTLLMTMNDVPGLGTVQPGFGQPDAMPLERRIIAHPAAKRLVIVDESRTSLHVLPLDVVAAMDRKGIDYLFVESVPVTSAAAGATYEYAVKALSKAGGLRYALDSGPEGMTITPGGVLRWAVPAAPAAERASVIVSVSDASGQSVFHTFTINVQGPPRAGNGPSAPRTINIQGPSRRIDIHASTR